MASERAGVLFKNALIYRESGDPFARGDLLVEGNRVHRIVYRPERLELPAGGPGYVVIEASNLALVPGFVDAHTHLLQTFGRGLMDGLPLTPWLRLIWNYRLSWDGYYYSTLLGAMEALASGTTCVSEMITECAHPDAVVQALVDSGLRASVAPAIADHMEGENTPVRATDAALKLAEEFVTTWNGKASGRLLARIAPVGLPACTKQLLRNAVELSLAHGVGLHTHACEGRAETEASLARFGKSEIAVLDECGVLTSRTQLVHVIWVDERDIGLIAQGGSSVVQCPSSNVRLLDGITPVVKMQRAGVPVALGGDGAASSGAYDMLVEGRFSAMLQRLATGEASVLSPRDVMSMLTRNGAVAAGWAGLGELSEGCLADMVGFNVDSPRLAAADHYALLSNIVFAASTRDVEVVMVDGKIVVSGGNHVALDVEDVARRAREVLGRERVPRSQVWWGREA
ncbi:MAG: amidohydrolase family protein [Betaproteobacteria bacterium]